MRFFFCAAEDIAKEVETNEKMRTQLEKKTKTVRTKRTTSLAHPGA